MNKKLIHNFKQELKKLEKSSERLNEIIDSGGIVEDEEDNGILTTAKELRIILNFLHNAGIVKSKKYIRYNSRIREAEHWYFPSMADNNCFM